MSKNPLIVFEGIETSGKSTSLKKAIKYLKKKKIKHITLREPGGTNFAEKLRSLMLSKKIILIDRFVDSTLAYQHYGSGLDKNLILKMNKFLLGNLKPNFTFLNVVNKKNLVKRLKLRKNINKYDTFNYNFYNKVQKGFLKIASKNKSKYLILDSNKDSLEIIENKLINKIENILK